MTLEECLRDIRGKTAVVRYLVSSATINPELPDPDVLAGTGTICEEIETLATAVSRSLTASTLALDITAERRD